MNKFLKSCFLLVALALCSQTAQKKAQTTIRNTEGVETELALLGKVQIELKDGTIKKDCILREISENGIVYMKDRALHDMQIEKVKKIRLSDGMHVISFDARNKAVMWFSNN
jgi:hypothetical protein